MKFENNEKAYINSLIITCIKVNKLIPNYEIKNSLFFPYCKYFKRFNLQSYSRNLLLRISS